LIDNQKELETKLLELGTNLTKDSWYLGHLEDDEDAQLYLGRIHCVESEIDECMVLLRLGLIRLVEDCLSSVDYINGYGISYSSHFDSLAAIRECLNLHAIYHRVADRLASLPSINRLTNTVPDIKERLERGSAMLSKLVEVIDMTCVSIPPRPHITLANCDFRME